MVDLNWHMGSLRRGLHWSSDGGGGSCRAHIDHPHHHHGDQHPRHHHGDQDPRHHHGGQDPRHHHGGQYPPRHHPHRPPIIGLSLK